MNVLVDCRCRQHWLRRVERQALEPGNLGFLVDLIIFLPLERWTFPRMSHRFLFRLYAMTGLSLNVSASSPFVCRTLQWLLIICLMGGCRTLYVVEKGILFDGVLILSSKSVARGVSSARIFCISVLVPGNPRSWNFRSSSWIDRCASLGSEQILRARKNCP